MAFDEYSLLVRVFTAISEARYFKAKIFHRKMRGGDYHLWISIVLKEWGCTEPKNRYKLSAECQDGMEFTNYFWYLSLNGNCLAKQGNTKKLFALEP